jgi:hypothetical protein
MASAKAATGSARASAAIAVADPAKESFSFANPLDWVDESRRTNLLLLLVLLLVFGLGLYCYARVGLDFGSVCDVFNASQTWARITSLAMIMFLFLFSLSIAVAAFASRGVPRLEAAAMAAVACLLPALFLGIAFPSYIYPFIGFAFAIVATAFFASELPPGAVSPSDAYSTISRAMLSFILAACLLALVAVLQNRDQYLAEFSSCLVGAAPMVMAQGAGALSKVVASFQVTPSQIEQYVSRDAVRAQLLLQARSQVEAMLPSATVRAQLSTTVAGFAALNASEQERLVNATYDAAVAKIINATNEDALINATYAQLSVQAGSLKQGLAKSLDDYAAKPPARMSKAEIAGIEAELGADPAYVQLREVFPPAMAFLVWSLLSIALIPVKAVAGLLAFLAFKLQK